jgi:predicted nucleotide-binding protein
MTLDEVKALLDRGGVRIQKESRLGNETGTQLRLSNGSIVNVFDKGTYNVQGKQIAQTQEMLGGSSASVAREGPAVYGGKGRVFVVYGHDGPARDQLEAMLRRWGLEPLILDQLPTEGQTVIEKLESALKVADFGVVLATPDDEGHRTNHPDEKAYRARQNVVLEMGMLLAKLGRPRVAILLKTQEKMERPSDIQGLIYIPFKDDLAKEAGVTLAKAMAAQGYQIDVARL